jgi:exosome complex RNA-binding protein Rrp4
MDMKNKIIDKLIEDEISQQKGIWTHTHPRRQAKKEHTALHMAATVRFGGLLYFQLKQVDQHQNVSICYKIVRFLRPGALAQVVENLLTKRRLSSNLSSAKFLKKLYSWHYYKIILNP